MPTGYHGEVPAVRPTLWKIRLGRVQQNMQELTSLPTQPNLASTRGHPNSTKVAQCRWKFDPFAQNWPKPANLSARRRLKLNSTSNSSLRRVEAAPTWAEFAPCLADPGANKIEANPTWDRNQMGFGRARPEAGRRAGKTGCLRAGARMLCSRQADEHTPKPAGSEGATENCWGHEHMTSAENKK